MFDPLEPRPSAVDECEAAIRHAIVTGAALPGTRLPPERKLAEDFGVNRVTVRTALSRLAAANLLRVRQGSGYVVQDFRAVGGPELIPELFPDAAPLAASLDVVADLLAVRRQLARTALERLVARAASDGVDLAPVQRAIDRLAALAATRADDRALADADLAVVGALLDATGSTVLKLCLNPVQRVIRALAPLRAAIYAAPETNVAAYRALLALLASGAPAAAVDRVAALLAERDAATLRKLATHPAAEDAPP
ncbi:MAG: GntR family transcriptional regulator [Myxococcales bacterium]|nr:GntR family transcriptional regulator [Myxococcales bacterium]MCB9732466.1 GntR family transcriptional regulator [Deltaproteobacteria bacterium]